MNNSDLKDLLFDTLNDLKDGKIEPADAANRALVAQTIINSAKIDIEAQKLANKTGVMLPFFEKGEVIEGETTPPHIQDNSQTPASIAAANDTKEPVTPSVLRPGNRKITTIGNKTVHKVR